MKIAISKTRNLPSNSILKWFYISILKAKPIGLCEGSIVVTKGTVRANMLAHNELKDIQNYLPHIKIWCGDKLVDDEIK